MNNKGIGELEKRIRELELQLRIEKEKNKTLATRPDVGLWEYIIAEKKLVQSQKLGGKWSDEDMVVENYREKMKGWGVIYPEDMDIFDAYCDSMDAGELNIIYEFRFFRDDSRFVWLRFEGNTICDENGKPVKVIGKTTDITRERQVNDLLEKTINRDMLTGLYSRDVARSMITRLINGGQSACGSLMIIDIDDFRQINERYGSLYGDKILEAAANTIYTSFKAKDIVGRLTGDEFIVFCPEVEDEAGVHKLINRLLVRFQEFLLDKTKKNISISIGVSLYPRDAKQFEELYRCADLALFYAKSRGKNQYSVYRKNAEYETSIGETYRKMKDEDKEQILSSRKSMNMNKELFDFAFDVISHDGDFYHAVQVIFSEVSLYFMIDRCTLMERSKLTDQIRITAKWSREDDKNDTELMEKTSATNWFVLEKYYKNIEYCILDDGKAMGENFSDDIGILYRQPVTAVQFPILEDGEMAGVLTFENWKDREWNEVAIATLSSITKMISSYMLRKQTKDELTVEYHVGKKAMDVQNLLYYVIDRSNYQIRYMSHYAKEIFRDAQIGRKCYHELMGKSEPCKECPMTGCTQQKKVNTVETYDEEEDSWYTLTAAVMEDQTDSSQVLVCRSDVTAFLNRVKGYDQLTGVLSYEKFRIEAVKLIRKKKEPYLLLFTGIQYFSRINDEYGYEAGDKILKLLADRVKTNLKEGELICRIKGDDFAVLLKSRTPEQLISLREKYSGYLTETFRKQFPDISLNCFTGVYRVSEGENISRCLDKAMMAKKEALKNFYESNGVYFYSQEFELRERAREEMNRMMKESLEKGQFKVYFQPKVDVVTDEIIGAEALVRLIGTDGRLIPPGRFIPLAEESGLVVEIDNFVYRETFRLMQKWLDEGLTVPVISVNLSRMHLLDDTLPQEMVNLSSKFGLRPQQIELEITESVFFEDTERLVRIIGQMKDMGYLISMDDFGAGFSTLSLMKSLPMDIIKIDGGFFLHNELDRKNKAVITSIMQLAGNLEYKTVSEGVETKEQVDFVRDNGGRYVQGYYYYRPMPADDFEKLLHAARA